MNRTSSMSQIRAGFSLDSGQENLSTAAVRMEDFGGPYSPRSSGYYSPAEPHFLDACHMCNRRLGDGRDIYMYKGDSAFCSEECRQQQIVIDERKEKSLASVTGMKKGQVSSSSSSTNNKPNYKAQAGTVAAA
ncbi:hypothetical protein SUGI_0173050 [Cryptomeria japonica]|uniref:FCS-Like Zinc finger 2 n=1 Tax=Cryptomeria japonica TaxID=3369 RepID=UPI002408E3FB|nr:FCS-Like Zinc finger 2 [Cryptomeria japonica]GLJ11621.1 hypothetical protein SUGI_0173050 [Cryptomeria japonica]